MIINFKSKYIKQSEIYTHTNLVYFHFYKDYEYLYTRRLIKYNDGKIKYLRINELNINNLSIVHNLCILSDQIINNSKLLFYAELEKNHIVYIQPVKYIKNKNMEQLIFDESYNIYNLQKLKDINFNNQLIIKKEILRQIKKQCINIINSRNILLSL